MVLIGLVFVIKTFVIEIVIPMVGFYIALMAAITPYLNKIVLVFAAPTTLASLIVVKYLITALGENSTTNTLYKLQSK